MTEQVFICIAILIFLYFIYQQYIFQKSIFFPQEAFTPQQVENIIQPPGSYKIGTADSNYIKDNNERIKKNGQNH